MYRYLPIYVRMEYSILQWSTHRIFSREPIDRQLRYLFVFLAYELIGCKAHANPTSNILGLSSSMNIQMRKRTRLSRNGRPSPSDCIRNDQSAPIRAASALQCVVADSEGMPGYVSVHRWAPIDVCYYKNVSISSTCVVSPLFKWKTNIAQIWMLRIDSHHGLFVGAPGLIWSTERFDSITNTKINKSFHFCYGKGAESFWIFIRQPDLFHIHKHLWHSYVVMRHRE